MAADVILRLFPDERVEWCSVEGSAGTQRGWPSEGSVVRWLLLPAEWVLRLQTPKVARSLQMLRQAIPFAVEDRLVAPVEQSHVALGEVLDPETIAVRVVDRECLRAALRRCEAKGLRVRAACSEAECLPVGEGPLIWIEQERVLLRPHKHSTVLVCSEDALPALWRAVITTPFQIVEVHCSGRLSEPQRRVLDDLVGPDAWRCSESVADPCTRLVQNSHAAQTAALGDLLQQDFAVRPASGDVGQWWRRAAWASLAASVLATTNLFLEQHQLQALLADAQQQMTTVLREAAPGISQVVDPRTQLEAELNRLRRGAAGADDALGLLAKVAPSLAGSTRFTLQAIEYRAGVLEITLSSTDVATLDGVRENLMAASGMQVELTGVTPGKGVVEGRLRIRGVGR